MLFKKKLRIFYVFMLFHWVGVAAEMIYLPAIPAIASAMHTNAAQLQAAFSYFFISYGVSMFVYGPIADAYGRKPTLWLGMMIAVIGAALSTFATNITILQIGIFLMGLGMGSGGMLSRTIARDLFEEESFLKAMVYLSIIFVLVPILSPVIGSLILHFSSWRGIFGFLLAFLLIAFIPISLFFEETAHRLTQRSLHNIMTSYLHLLKDRRFLVLAFLGMINLAVVMIYEAVTFTVYQDALGMTPIQQGLMTALTSIGSIIGAQLSVWAAKRVSLQMELIFANLIAMLSASWFLAVVWLDALTVWDVFFSVFFLFLANGVIFSVTTAKAMRRAHNDNIGLAGALLGGVQNAAIGICITLLTFHSLSGLLAAATLMLMGTILGMIIIFANFHLLTRHHL